MEDIMQIVLLCLKFGCQRTSFCFARVFDIEHIIVFQEHSTKMD